MIKTRVIINQGLTEGQTLGNLLEMEAASTHAERMMFSPNYCSRSKVHGNSTRRLNINVNQFDPFSVDTLIRFD